MLVWIDIENPPQVQFLLPFDAAFRAAGAEVVITARDSGIAFELLRQRGAVFRPIGAHYGKSRRRKVVGMLGRTLAFLRFFAESTRPNVLLCASRASALAARILGSQSFILSDYEYSNLTVYRWSASSFLYPDAISPEAFLRRGIRSDRLLPFRGLKEDISFAGVELEAIPAQPLPEANGLVKVLFRPPAEESHYYRPESGDLTIAALDYLSRNEQAVVVFSPRYRWQTAVLSRFSWKHEPIVLSDAVSFVSLLKAVDLVVSSGGTMLREAAYLGIPAYSIFRSRIGGVDRHLAASGRLRIIETPSDLAQIELRPKQPLRMLRSNPELLSELVDFITARVKPGDTRPAAPPAERRNRVRGPAERSLPC